MAQQPLGQREKWSLTRASLTRLNQMRYIQSNTMYVEDKGRTQMHMRLRSQSSLAVEWQRARETYFFIRAHCSSNCKRA